MTDNAWVSDAVDAALAAGYEQHTASLRGLVRQHLVTRALEEHLPGGGRILDVGGGSGVQAVALARLGHEVTICDPDSAMLAAATERLAEEPPEVAARVALVEGDGHDAAALCGDGWDATLCHGVLMYLSDPGPLLGVLVEVTRPGGLISVVAKNAAALAMRAALQGRWHDAHHLLDADMDTETGNLGRASRGDDVGEIADTLALAGARMRAWYGVRVFTDHLADTPAGPELKTICDLEWEAGTRDPYRAVARLFHLLAARQPS